jgi:hypothetical protein
MKTALRKADWRWGISLAVALSCAALAGCDDDDNKNNEAPAAEADAGGGAAENNAGGGGAEAPNAAPNEPAPGAALSVAGEWNGVITSREGNGHMELDLRQAGDVVTGQFYLTRDGFGGQTGQAAGRLDGNRLRLQLAVRGSDITMDMDGRVNANATSYTGQWALGALDNGNFALQK